MIHTLQFFTYPDGDADFMNKDEIVLRLTNRGSLTDCYAGELCDGDSYCQRIQVQLGKRTPAQILNFIMDRGVCISYHSSGSLQRWFNNDHIVDAEFDHTVIELRTSDGTLLVKYPYDNELALREAIEFVMDQEEL
jgi:hypothetical protein